MISIQVKKLLEQKHTFDIGDTLQFIEWIDYYMTEVQMCSLIILKESEFYYCIQMPRYKPSFRSPDLVIVNDELMIKYLNEVKVSTYSNYYLFFIYFFLLKVQIKRVVTKYL